ADIPESVEVYSEAEPGVRMALKIDTSQCCVGVPALRDARLRLAAAGQGRLGSPFRMTLPPVRRTAGDWGMSTHGSRV
ncbi:MAG TPA: hypothetical protein VF086_19020, partial [Propionibacteriaceae bacterium]